MKQAVLTTIAQSLNHYLSLDDDYRERLAKIEGKVIAFHLKRPKVVMFFFMQHDSIHIEDHYDGEPDTHIYTSIFQLMKMKLSNNIDKNDFYIEGDAEVASLLNDLLKNHDIDWEEHASKLIGDTLAYKFGRFAKRQRHCVEQVSQSMKQNVTEFLQEETNALPPRQMIADFFDDVDATRADADRLQARVALLQQRLDSEACS